MDVSLNKVQTDNQIKELANTAKQIWFEYFPGIISLGQVEYMVEKFQSYHALKEQIENGGYSYYVLLDENDTILGFCGIKPETDKLFLSKLYVRKENRGQGLGGKMLDYVVSYAKEKSLGAVYLTVNKENESSIAVYKKRGFNTICQKKADIGSGYYMDDFVMEKKIAL